MRALRPSPFWHLQSANQAAVSHTLISLQKITFSFSHILFLTPQWGSALPGILLGDTQMATGHSLSIALAYCIAKLLTAAIILHFWLIYSSTATTIYYLSVYCWSMSYFAQLQCEFYDSAWCLISYICQNIVGLRYSSVLVHKLQYLVSYVQTLPLYYTTYTPLHKAARATRFVHKRGIDDSLSLCLMPKWW